MVTPAPDCDYRDMSAARFAGIRGRVHDLRTRALTDRRWLAAGLGILAVLVLANDSGVSPGVVLAGVLIAVGAMLLRPEETEQASSDAGRVVERTRPVRVRRPRSKLFLITVAAVFVVLGIALIFDVTGPSALELGSMSALPLLVIGTGLIVGAWWGRSRFLILIGLALIPIVAATSIVDLPLTGRVGGFYEMPRSPGQLQEDYRVLIGSGTLDLSRLRLEGEDVTLPIELGLGEIDVLVPETFAVMATARLRGGNVYVLGQSESGRRIAITAGKRQSLREKGSLTLVINGEAGSIAVEEVWTPMCWRKGNCAEIRQRRERKAEQRAERRREERRRETRDTRGRDRDGERKAQRR